MTSNSPASGCDRVVPLASQVENCLRSSGYASLRMLTVTQSQDRIHIAGEVPSYYMKQVASVLAMAASELTVQNELIVV